MNVNLNEYQSYADHLKRDTLKSLAKKQQTPPTDNLEMIYTALLSIGASMTRIAAALEEK